MHLSKTMLNPRVVTWFPLFGGCSSRKRLSFLDGYAHCDSPSFIQQHGVTFSPFPPLRDCRCLESKQDQTDGFFQLVDEKGIVMGVFQASDSSVQMLGHGFSIQSQITPDRKLESLGCTASDSSCPQQGYFH